MQDQNKNNTTKRAIDIADRQKIVNNYKSSYYLDRQKAIKKIVDLRVENEEVLAVAAEEQMIFGAVPLTQLSNDALVGELQKQIDFLVHKDDSENLKRSNNNETCTNEN